jgi:proline dehydrogenase
MPGLRRRALFHLATNPLYERVVVGVPSVRAVARRRAARYIAGETFQDAVGVVRALAGHGIGASLDFFGERVTDPEHARRVADTYVELAGALSATPATTQLALDLSHLAFDTGHLLRIAAALPAGRLLQVGAEEAHTADRVHAALLRAHADGLPVAATLQANLRRPPTPTASPRPGSRSAWSRAPTSRPRATRCPTGPRPTPPSPGSPTSSPPTRPTSAAPA